MPHIAQRAKDISPFYVMEIAKAAFAMQDAGRSVIHLEIGEPDFPTPEPVLAAAQAYLAKGEIYYTQAYGTPALRQAIAGFYQSQYGVTVDPKRIIVTAGASAALLLACALCLERDEQVLVTDPSYPCNRQFIRTVEALAVAVPVGASTQYQFTAELIEQHWQAQTKAVLVASPSNPTGTSVPEAEMAKIVQTVKARDGFLIVDEIYQGLSYGRQASTVLSHCEPNDEVLVINSFSKYFNMTGWRLGWLIAPPQHMAALERIAQNLFISPSSLSQHAALACFTPETLAIAESRRQAFQERRDLLLAELPKMGFKIPVQPDGGFFVYADCSAFTQDSFQFCFDVLAATGVCFAPGKDFGEHQANTHVRMAYAVSYDKLQEAMRRLAHFLSKNH
jgi:aspartate/methionine/tyrosine aminotransferase